LQFSCFVTLVFARTIGQKIEAPFKTAADEIEGFFASLGAKIKNDNKKY